MHAKTCLSPSLSYIWFLFCFFSPPETDRLRGKAFYSPGGSLKNDRPLIGAKAPASRISSKDELVLLGKARVQFMNHLLSSYSVFFSICSHHRSTLPEPEVMDTAVYQPLCLTLGLCVSAQQFCSCVHLSAKRKHGGSCRAAAIPSEPGTVVLPQASPLAQCWVKTSPVVWKKKYNTGAQQSAFPCQQKKHSHVLDDNDTDTAPTMHCQPLGIHWRGELMLS